MRGEELGQFLKDIRGNMTLDEVAHCSKVSKSYISRIENGTRHPSPEILKKLAACYHQDFDELMEIAEYTESECEQIKILRRAEKKLSPDQLSELIGLIKEKFPDTGL